MPVPSTITELSQTAASNPPTGGETPIEGDNHIRQIYSFIANLRDTKVGGTGGTMTGNLGIGEPTPAVPLHIKGALATARVRVESTGGVVGEFLADGANALAQLGTNTSSALVLSTGSTERLRITAAGVIQDGAARQIGHKNIVRNTTYGSIGEVSAISADITVSTGAQEQTFMVYNDGANPITLVQGAGLTLRLAGTTTTGNRTVAPRGFCTLWWNTASECVAMGPGVS